ncbi:MAG: flagellar hook-basal body complex protein [Candidatus Devosia phytovorans]|uniref:Flagellar hook protein FlgE n=1 Tax=Candidatus Devosia phytovorans TaxID=3121372 RepID=A0AAJ6B1N2_9HYPH|nr:flagellar hook-basal body complex protein [Devosia sp.]WEK05529.1 MAG: flagellar hook-basal body complex protein [Devosia sp.]
MGIYGALSSAVTGLRAQSHALENISGNIANSQTTGYKRIETDFLDLIPDAPVRRQVPGAVLAQSRGTNGEAGDIKTVSNETYIALNSNGFFVVEPKVGQSDGNSVFAGTNFYTRRGDFEIDKDGYLVNGAGYYLKGLPIDPGTGNISGSVPEVIKLSNAFLPAQQTNRINYQANLPQLPKPSNYKATVPNSELFRAADYDPAATFTPAQSVSNAAWPTDVDDLAGDTLTVTMGGAPFTYHFVDGGTIPTDNATNRYINIAVAPNDSIGGVLTNIQSHMNGRTNGSGSTVALDGTGRLVVTMPANSGVALAVSGTDGATATPTAVAFTDSAPVSSVPYGSPIETISANQNTQFLSNSISGGAITVYAENGAPANVQMRWAKVSSTATGGADVWHLYYMSNSNAANGDPMWTRVPENFQFAPNGSLASPTNGATTLSNLTVNGVSIGDVEFRYDTNGLSQFADVNGTANVSTLNQNGYGAGEFVSVAINDNGRVVATYSNGERIDMAQVVTAEFNAINQLKRLDGGVFTSTSESGEAILDLSGSGILGGSLEASNTDISDEFTKLIVTQQAYAAGTRIVSTADEMLQEALNMIR